MMHVDKRIINVLTFFRNPSFFHLKLHRNINKVQFPIKHALFIGIIY